MPKNLESSREHTGCPKVVGVGGVGNIDGRHYLISSMTSALLDTKFMDLING